MSEPTPALPAASVRHDLPSGGWVELRDLDSLKARDNKAVLRAIHADPTVGSKMAFGVDMTDGLISVMVADWKIPYGEDWPIPRLCIMHDPETGTPVVLDDLTAADYAELQRLVLPAQKVLFPAKPEPGQAEDPASPTEPASA